MTRSTEVEPEDMDRTETKQIHYDACLARQAMSEEYPDPCLFSDDDEKKRKRPIIILNKAEEEALLQLSRDADVVMKDDEKQEGGRDSDVN